LKHLSKGLPRAGATRGAQPRERAALVGLALRRSTRLDAEHSLEELAALADAAGAAVALRMIQERPTPDPATFIGRGKLDELAEGCARVGADLVIFDNELSPAQLRQIEEKVNCKVIDRTQLILDIFARRARTREGKWQVELAQLKYLLPRLVGAGSALSRLGGGIGTRGPGETKLETDRRRIRQRIHAISLEIEAIRGRRRHARGRRQKASVPLAALVGYTNAGKTTLFNRLTKESAEASNALFVTLDPLVRQVSLPDKRQLLLSDTVGFIERLPHTLVAAFRATLEQVAEADLILHVIDAASPDRERHVEAVRRVLDEMDAGRVAKVDVFNKMDLVEDADAGRLRSAHPDALFISALRGNGRRDVIDAVAKLLELDTRRVRLEFDSESAEDRETIARVYRHARVVSHEARDGRIAIEADVPRRILARLSPSPRVSPLR
jgi:GTP-binding protein HflX